MEVIENEWHGVPYKIIHRDSKYWTWNLSFTGIELPRYDNWYSGSHNGMVKGSLHIFLQGNSEKPIANREGYLME